MFRFDENWHPSSLLQEALFDWLYGSTESHIGFKKSDYPNRKAAASLRKPPLL